VSVTDSPSDIISTVRDVAASDAGLEADAEGDDAGEEEAGAVPGVESAHPVRRTAAAASTRAGRCRRIGISA